MPESPRSWPTELKLDKDRRRLTISFEDGRVFVFDAEYLRVFSPSAEVQGHAPHERKTVGGKAEVAILELVPTGNYAVRIDFDDGHDTGIYGWDYFAELGTRRVELWQGYLDELAAKGLSRESPDLPR